MNSVTIRTVINGYVLEEPVDRNCVTRPRVFGTLKELVDFLDEKLERPDEGPDADLKHGGGARK